MQTAFENIFNRILHKKTTPTKMHIMRRLSLVAALCGTIILSSSKPTGNDFTANPADYLIQSVLWYQSSPEMTALYYQGYNVATANLTEFAKKQKKSKKPLAVVVDIDETMLDNSPMEGYLIHKGTAYKQEIWKEWSNMAKAKALPGAVDFTKHAKSLNVDIIYISNRDTTEIAATEKNLKNEGFEFADQDHFYFKTSGSSKDARRKQVLEKYNIVMLIGDNLSDFNTLFDKRDGSEFEYVKQFRKEFGRSYIILPNPMYGDWEKPITKGAKNEAEKYKAIIDKVVGF